MSKKHMMSKTALSVVTAGLMAFAPVSAPLAHALGIAPAVALATDVDYSNAVTIDVSSLTEGSYEGYKVEAAEILDESGNAVTAYAGTTVTIQEAGTYVLTGTAEDVNVAVKKGVTGVTLVLDNLSLSCDYTAPITVKKTAEVTIELVGTSTLTDNESLSNDGVLADYEGSCIKAKDGSTLTIQGSGTLNIVGNCKNGIRATCNPGEDGETGSVTLNILSGTYNISVQDENSASDTAADGDAIHSDDVLNIGYEGMSDSELVVNVTKACEGLEGGTVNIYGGEISVTSADDGINAANSDYASAGISYTFGINIYGGNIKVLCGGDCIDSNGNILTQAGNVFVCSTSGGNGAFDPGDGNYSWTNVNATVVALGQGSMEVTPSSGTYVAFGAVGRGGMMGGGMMGGRGMGTLASDEATTDKAAAAETEVAEAEATEGTALEVQARGGWGGQMPTDGTMPTNMGQGGQMGGMMGGGTAIVSSGQALTLSDGTTTIDLGSALGNAASVIVVSPSLTEGTSYTLYADGTEVATSAAATGSAAGQGGFQPGGQGGQMPTDGTMPEPPADGQFPGRNQGGWQRTADGWVFVQADGTKATEWLQEAGVWYYLGSDGVMVTGWNKVDGTWFLFDGVNGDMKTGWQQDGNTWYYLGSSGAMKTGWQQWNGGWYYLNWDGAMLTSTTTPDGYTVDANGRWV